jgi:hypothetical protein
MSAPVRLSPTSLTLYGLCGEAWKQRYINRRYTPMGVNVFKGLAVHKAAEENYRLKATTRKDLPVPEIVKIAVDAFDRETKENEIHWTASDLQEGKGAVLARVRDELAKSATCYAEQVAPGVQPIGIDGDPAVELELWTRLTFPEADVNLQVKIDCVSSEDGLIRIHDLKVSSKQKDQMTWDRDLQMTLNWIALTERMKAEPEAIVVDQVVDYKKGPKHIPVYTTRNEVDLEVAKRHVLAQVLGVRSGNFPPAPPGSWKCSSDYCYFYLHGCEYVNSERIPPLKIEKDEALKELLGDK